MSRRNSKILTEYQVTQGRIKDLKLGVAQMDWEILKTGGAGGWGGGGD